MKTVETTVPDRAAPWTACCDGTAPDNGHDQGVVCTRSAEDHERAILAAVQYIKAHYRRHLTVSEMAHEAMYSRFHFTRIFRELTGMPPCQFLTATRIAEAKRLLSGTDRTVADICASVGYQSLGTFTTRFTELVGLPPGRFRLAARRQAGILGARGEASGPRQVDLVGCCRPPDGQRIITFVGAYAAPLPHGVPVAWTTAGPDGRFRLSAPGPGRFHLLAAGPLPCLAPGAGPAPGDVSLVGHVPVEAGDRAAGVDVTIDLRPRRPHDPPFLTAIPPVRGRVTV